MAISYGSIALQGLIGGVMGGAKAAYELSIEEQKAERKKVEEERLSKLRLGEYEHKAKFDQKLKDEAEEKQRKLRADFYKSTGPKERTYTDTLGDETEGAAAGQVTSMEPDSAVSKRRVEEAKKLGDKGLISEVLSAAELEERRAERGEDRADRRRDREERAKDRDEDRKDRRAAREEARADREEARKQAEKLAKLAQDRDWKVDADGNYRRPDGSVVTEEIREGGKLLGTKPVKAPTSKVSGKDWKTQEELDSLNRRIENAEKNNDTETVARLEREKEKLLGRGARATSASTSARPPLSSFGK